MFGQRCVLTLTIVLFLLPAPSFNDSIGLRYPSRPSYVRRQPYYTFPFPCSNSTLLKRSKKPPTSVHRLRPGDIDVVGAIGDSLVAGNGALEEYALGAFVEHRGVSWCTGGDGSWREYLTLPNILKEFNPGLKGFSTGTGEFLERNSKFNLAFPVASDRDALRQAKRLVTRMKASPEVDFKNDWKVITIFMGANDLCSWSCRAKEEFSAKRHADKLAVALDYLKENLPRTFVNLVPVLDVSVSVRVQRSPMCRLMHSLFCSCFHQWSGGRELQELVHKARLYQRAEKILVDSGRYDDREDFTVVLQPFMNLFNAPDPPKPAEELPLVIHSSYITHDCFHFSQKGHALAANLLWNNMLEPYGSKTFFWPPRLMRSFLCPTKQAPYLYTRKNTQLQNNYVDDT